jgi:hypothetical protein
MSVNKPVNKPVNKHINDKKEIISTIKISTIKISTIKISTIKISTPTPINLGFNRPVYDYPQSINYFQNYWLNNSFVKVKK